MSSIIVVGMNTHEGLHGWDQMRYWMVYDLYSVLYIPETTAC